MQEQQSVETSNEISVATVDSVPLNKEVEDEEHGRHNNSTNGDKLTNIAIKFEDVKNSTPMVQYVIVSDGEDSTCERLELPLDPIDNSLGLNTLAHAFPGASGLKYRNATSGAYRGLLYEYNTVVYNCHFRMDATGTKFLAPLVDGWSSNTVYIVISQTQPTPSSSSHHQYRSTDQNTKRKKMMDSANESDDDTNGQLQHMNAKQKRLDSSKNNNNGEQSSTVVNNKCTDLIVLGLPFKATNNELKEYFEQFGEVVVSEVKTDFKTGKSKGFGFVQFADMETQLKVLAQQIHYIDGRNCQGDTIEQTCPKIFVGRVPEKMTTDELRHFFNAEAKKLDSTAMVLDVFIPRPFRAFAFVTFSDSRVSRDIIRRQDFVINGASVTVSMAAPKDPTNTDSLSSSSSSRGGGGGRWSASTHSNSGDGGSNNRMMSNASSSKRYYDRSSPSPYYDHPPPHHHHHQRWTDPVPPSNTIRDSRSIGGMNSSSRYSPVPRSMRGSTNRSLPSVPPINNSSSSSSAVLASGIDALNLNQMNQTLSHMNPDVVSAAWQAFWNTLQQQQNGGNNGGGHAPWQSRMDDPNNHHHMP